MTTFRIITIIVISVIFVCALYLILFKQQATIPTPITLLTPAPSALGTETPSSSILPSVSPIQPINVKNGMHQITLKTNVGTIVFETYDADAPKAVQNFIMLTQKGFYNNLTFHRVIKGFMIQGGDPNGDGRGGPGYSFEDELNPATESYKAGYKRGVVAMANAGQNTNGSQFFIMHQDYALPHSYTIFGKVVSGQDVIDAIANVKTDGNDKPLDSVIIKEATITQK